ncbi:hypothetical protein BM523_05010 [Alteromonas mediterranea]|nr:hypothetical protein BM523_05010 [Alteromonas mediterranea]APD97047.1 hypothetical protein BM525_05065 [Alteromonas mediterranea]QGX61118.1 tetratricopeptide repeat protein [Alteromonas mediterranea]
MRNYKESSKAMNIVQQLVSAYQQKQYQKIIQFIEKQLFLLQKDPVFVQLFSGSLRQVQRVKDAERYLEKGLKKFKNHPELLNSLGNLYFATERVQLAISTLQKASLLAPKNVDLHYNLGRALVANEELHRAKGEIEKVLSLAPSHVHAKLVLADILSKQLKYEDAISIFEDILRLVPNNLLALNNIANLYRKLEDYEQALVYFENALLLDNENPTVLRNYAAVLALANKRREAHDIYLRAVGVAPHDWLVQQEFAKYLWEEDAEEPFAHINKYLKQNPHDDDFRFRYIQLLIQADEYESANSQIKLLSTDSLNLHAVAPLKARVLRELGEYESSIAAVSNISNPSNGIALLSERGYSLLCLGRTKEALDCFNKLVKKEPLNQGWWTMLSTCWSMAGEEARYKWLCDYEKLVYVNTIKHSQLDTHNFNNKLQDVLLERHKNQRHPIGQSLKNGTQTYEDLFLSSSSLIEELSKEILVQASAFIKDLKTDKAHPFYSRLSDKLKYIGSWSVRLRNGGFHKSHYHPEGWLSGVYYVDVPKAVDTAGQGWLMFGRADIANQCFEGDYAVKPKNGTLVLFPSYMWHGTNAFSTNEHRLTVAFDIVPEAQ